MSQIRVLHELRWDESRADDALRYVRGVRAQDGCREAEVYKGISEPERAVMLELWEDDEAYAAFWNEVLRGVEDDFVLDRLATGDVASSEFYHLQYFHPARIWVADRLPVADARRSIVWPARGGVRIVVQTSPSDVEAAVAGLLEDQAATRRETGCLDYSWLRGIEFPGHALLIELWSDQAVYDAHWNLRLKVGEAARQRGAADTFVPSTAERQQGRNGLEFYRHQPFMHQYDRWLPTDSAQLAETVVWPD